MGIWVFLGRVKLPEGREDEGRGGTEKFAYLVCAPDWGRFLNSESF